MRIIKRPTLLARYVLSICLLILLLLGWPRAVRAASFFVEPTAVEQGASMTEAESTRTDVMNSVTLRRSNTLVSDSQRADFTLQPKLIRVGGDYVFTVEKKRGPDLIFSAQAKVGSIEELSRAVRLTTLTALDEAARERIKDSFREKTHTSASNEEPPGGVPFDFVQPQNAAQRDWRPAEKDDKATVSGTTSSPQDARLVGRSRR